MKKTAISLWQPWSSLVVMGIKKIETRGYYTSRRGKIYIHSAKVTGINMAIVKSAFQRFINYLVGYEKYEQLPYGMIVGEVDIIDVRKWEDVKDLLPPSNYYIPPEQEEMGDCGPGRFMWYLANPIRYEKPIPYRGQQGFFPIEIETP